MRICMWIFRYILLYACFSLFSFRVGILGINYFFFLGGGIWVWVCIVVTGGVIVQGLCGLTDKLKCPMRGLL